MLILHPTVENVYEGAAPKNDEVGKYSPEF